MPQAPAYGSRGKQRIVALPEAASQTFKKGDFLTLDANGRVQQALSAGNNVGGISVNATGNRIVGRAEADASGTTGKLAPVMTPGGTQFELPVYNPTPASAVPSTAQIGKQYDLRYATGSPKNFWAVDISSTANPKLKIVDMLAAYHTGWDGAGYPTAASTTQYGNVWVEFLDEASAIQGATMTAIP